MRTTVVIVFWGTYLGVDVRGHAATAGYIAPDVRPGVGGGLALQTSARPRRRIKTQRRQATNRIQGIAVISPAYAAPRSPAPRLLSRPSPRNNSHRPASDGRESRSAK